MSSFYNEFKSANNLYEAWRHVRKSASQSSNPDIRAAADDFENKAHTYLKSIQGRLVARSYKFPKSLGVLKDKKAREKQGKSPRPIVISTLEARIVQRAILQVLQPAKSSKLYNQIGKLKFVNESPYGIGGIPHPYGGVAVGIKSVLKDMNDGYKKFYKSDIQAFFTKIPHASIVTFIEKETKDAELAKIFGEGLKVELSNQAELADYFELFPKDGVGVPQGSSLSALAGNVLLLELDTKLNDGVTTAYRYIDDLIILGKTTEQVDKAKSLAIKWLKKQGMSLYEPKKGSDKAEAGDAKDSFTFLGCKLAPNQVEPAKKAKRSLLDKIEKEISNSKKSLSTFFDHPTKSRQTQQGYAQTLARIDKIIYGWGYSISFCNNRLPFKTLDADITKLLDSFEQWFTTKLKAVVAVQKRRGLGISLLQDIENTYSQISAEPVDYIES